MVINMVKFKALHKWAITVGENTNSGFANTNNGSVYSNSGSEKLRS